MNYLAIALNHFKALQAWLRSNDGEATLDISSFELEVRCRQRYYKLFPQFVAQKDGRYIYEPHLTSDSFGFIGWLPYRSITWPMSTDKLKFKSFVQEAGERTPDFWTDPAAARQDYVLKRSRGSFGDDLAGPFRLGAAASANGMVAADGKGTLFAERFIQGEILKVWFWGNQAIYAQRREYPDVSGDGRSTLRTLINERLALNGKQMDTGAPDYPTLMSSLSYQGLTLDDVLPEGACAWLDYRYGRNYARGGLRTSTDDALTSMTEELLLQINRIGTTLANELDRFLGAPVLFSADAVIENGKNIWWLEMNSNPTLPPDGYPYIFARLFGTRLASEPSRQSVALIVH